MKRRDLLKKAAGLVAAAAAAPVVAEAAKAPALSTATTSGTGWVKVAMGDSLTHGTVTAVGTEGVWANYTPASPVLMPKHFDALIERIEKGGL